jgi:hypothetical protein
VLTATEIGVLDRLVNDRPKARQKTLSRYLIKIARLGGYLARASDPPPGNTVMWRGLLRLTDIALGESRHSQGRKTVTDARDNVVQSRLILSRAASEARWSNKKHSQNRSISAYPSGKAFNYPQILLQPWVE